MQTLSPSIGSKAFGELADPGLIVAYQSHQDALRFLASALGQANGVALLQGPAGSGKTTIINEQLDWSSRDAAVALLDGAHLAPRQMVSDMLAQFGVDIIPLQDDQILQTLNNFVTAETRAGQVPVLMIDNADLAPSSALLLLNWLAALEVGGSFALRIVLAGKEQLKSHVRQDGMRSLTRRNPATYTLNPMTAHETMIYLRTRLIAAGGERSEKIFPVDVCDKLREKSRGWPGQLNSRAIEVLERISELQSARPAPRIIVTCNGETVAEHSLTKRQYVIGRNELADIVVDDNYVSKMHAMLQVYGNAVVLLDLNSTNGTSVNATDVQKTILRESDIITIGTYRLKIENVPVPSADMDASISASDTLTIQHLEDLRRSRARHTIAALKHK